MRWRIAALLVMGAIGVCTPGAAYGATPGMQLGFTDVVTIQETPLARPLALQRLKGTRATIIRLMWRWRDIEVLRPPDDRTARDPGWTGYDWTALDATLRDIAAAGGLTALVEVSGAPPWWEGPERPAVSDAAPQGTWRPNAAAFGRFMHAAARRYAGNHPDPLRPGSPLPRVRLWQAWNEPNLDYFLSPQWTRTQNGFKSASPAWYKVMLNTAYDEIKSATSGATVFAAGTAPFGDPNPGGLRMPAGRFVRELLCVSGRVRPKARRCARNPVKFDAMAHHPYPIGPPGRHALNPDDIVVPDFDKIKRPLAVALAAGNVYPRKRKPIWATEMSWDSSPPDPGGIEWVTQARYAAGAMYVLWRQGIRTLLWWNLHDDPRGSGYQNSLQSGVYMRGETMLQDSPKPLLTAFRFPFVAYGTKSRSRGRRLAKIWGMAPSAGQVQIQRQYGSSWRTVLTVRAARNRIFQARLPAGRGARLRATQAGEISIDAKVF